MKDFGRDYCMEFETLNIEEYGYPLFEEPLSDEEYLDRIIDEALEVDFEELKWHWDLENDDLQRQVRESVRADFADYFGLSLG